MLSAAIKAAPVFGAKLKSFDAAKIASMKGVKKVVQVEDNAVAVVADTWGNAKTALEALPVAWEASPNDKGSSSSIAAFLKAGLAARAAFCGRPARRPQARPGPAAPTG